MERRWKREKDMRRGGADDEKENRGGRRRKRSRRGGEEKERRRGEIVMEIRVEAKAESRGESITHDRNTQLINSRNQINSNKSKHSFAKEQTFTSNDCTSKSDLDPAAKEFRIS